MSNLAAAEKLLHKKRKSYPFPNDEIALRSDSSAADKTFVSSWSLLSSFADTIALRCLAGSDENPRHKKRKTSSPIPSSSSWSLLSSLPYDITLRCLAGSSKSDKAGLSMVSKSYRSLMASPELEKTRSLMGFTETSLYVCLLTHPDPIPRWFILRRKPEENRLVGIPIPSSPSQPTEGSSVVVLDHWIYVIGGCSTKGKPRSSNVLLLDCRNHTWSRAPSMREARASAAVGVVNGKIYVFGGCRDPDCSNWAEVFDPKTQTWDALPPLPDSFMRGEYIHTSAVVMEDKIYAGNTLAKTFYYSPKQGQWGRLNTLLKGNRHQRDWCCIDGLVYGIRGDLYWCEPEQLECEVEEGMLWRKVEGLGSLQKFLSSSRVKHFCSKYMAMWEETKIPCGHNEELADLLPGARLASSGGGNIVVFWDVVEGNRLEIWCAEIALERRKGPEVWGNIVWSSAVMTVDPFSNRYKPIDR